MPEIDLGNWESGLNDFAPIRVFATMLFPKDDSRREEFLHFAMCKAPLEPKYGEVPSLDYRVLKEEADYLTNGEPVRHGWFAGGILVAVRQIAECCSAQEATIHRAIHLVSAEMVRGATPPKAKP